MGGGVSGGKANPQRGTRFEHAVKADLTERGYFCMRSPASKSPIDILAVGPDDALFVQCKTNGRLDPAPWNEIYDLALEHGGTPLLASKPMPGFIRYMRLITAKRERGADYGTCEPWGVL
jgi:Holliday junction resolvase